MTAERKDLEIAIGDLHASLNDERFKNDDTLSTSIKTMFEAFRSTLRDELKNNNVTKKTIDNFHQFKVFIEREPSLKKSNFVAVYIDPIDTLLQDISKLQLGTQRVELAAGATPPSDAPRPEFTTLNLEDETSVELYIMLVHEQINRINKEGSREKKVELPGLLYKKSQLVKVALADEKASSSPNISKMISSGIITLPNALLTKKDEEEFLAGLPNIKPNGSKADKIEILIDGAKALLDSTVPLNPEIAEQQRIGREEERKENERNAAMQARIAKRQQKSEEKDSRDATSHNLETKTSATPRRRRTDLDRSPAAGTGSFSSPNGEEKDWTVTVEESKRQGPDSSSATKEASQDPQATPPSLWTGERIGVLGFGVASMSFALVIGLINIWNPIGWAIGAMAAGVAIGGLFSAVAIAEPVGNWWSKNVSGPFKSWRNRTNESSESSLAEKNSHAPTNSQERSPAAPNPRVDSPNKGAPPKRKEPKTPRPESTESSPTNLSPPPSPSGEGHKPLIPTIPRKRGSPRSRADSSPLSRSPSPSPEKSGALTPAISESPVVVPIHETKVLDSPKYTSGSTAHVFVRAPNVSGGSPKPSEYLIALNECIRSLNNDIRTLRREKDDVSSEMYSSLNLLEDQISQKNHTEVLNRIDTLLLEEKKKTAPNLVADLESYKNRALQIALMDEVSKLPDDSKKSELFNLIKDENLNVKNENFTEQYGKIIQLLKTFDDNTNTTQIYKYLSPLSDMALAFIEQPSAIPPTSSNAPTRTL